LRLLVVAFEVDGIQSMRAVVEITLAADTLLITTCHYKASDPFYLMIIYLLNFLSLHHSSGSHFGKVS
jgi:hypothetical protein